MTRIFVELVLANWVSTRWKVHDYVVDLVVNFFQ